MTRWWGTADLDRKLPVLIELFVSSCEAAVRSLLDPQLDWTADQLAAKCFPFTPVARACFVAGLTHGQPRGVAEAIGFIE